MAAFESMRPYRPIARNRGRNFFKMTGLHDEDAATLRVTEAMSHSRTSRIGHKCGNALRIGQCHHAVICPRRELISPSTRPDTVRHRDIYFHHRLENDRGCETGFLNAIEPAILKAISDESTS